MYLAIYRPEYVEGIGSFDPLFSDLTVRRVEAPLIDYQKSIDHILSELIKDELLSAEIDGIIIPLSLTQDYTNFTGIRLGMHIRYSDYEGLKRDIPIIFVGEESASEVSKINPIGFFLFTQGVYLTNENRESIDNILQENLQGTNLDYIQNTLCKVITPEAPDFFDNRHSVINNWSLIILDQLSGHNILQEENKLKETRASLYIKWLLTKEKKSFSEFQPKNEPFVLNNVVGKKILIIDDEWEKGWLALYEAFFREEDVDGAEVSCLGINKSWDRTAVLKELEEELIREPNWDLFILDIHLIESDHNDDTDYKDYTGFQVLKKIKELNPGNQVVIVSASDKQWIYEYGRYLKADKVFIKPSFNSDLLSSPLEELSRAVLYCLDRTYLKEYYQGIQTLSTDLISLNKKKKLQKEFINNLIAYLNAGFSSLAIPHEEKYTISFLNFYQVVEFINIELVGSNKIKSPTEGQYYWEFRNGNNTLDFFKIEDMSVTKKGKLITQGKQYPSNVQKLYNLLWHLCRCRQGQHHLFVDAKEIIERRNSYIHPDLDEGARKFSKLEVDNLFNLIKTLLNALCVSLMK